MFKCFVVMLELGLFPSISSQGPIYVKRLSCYAARSSKRIINSLCELEYHMGPVEPCGWEGGTVCGDG